MLTTTDRRTLLGAGAFALAAWFAGLAILAYTVEPSREVIAWVPQGRLAATISAAPVTVLEGQGGGFLRLRGESPGFVGLLYASGAWIVFPAAGGGCRSARPRIAG
jgi:hypothetical protein